MAVTRHPGGVSPYDPNRLRDMTITAPSQPAVQVPQPTPVASLRPVAPKPPVPAPVPDPSRPQTRNIETVEPYTQPEALSLRPSAGPRSLPGRNPALAVPIVPVRPVPRGILPGYTSNLQKTASTMGQQFLDSTAPVVDSLMSGERGSILRDIGTAANAPVTSDIRIASPETLDKVGGYIDRVMGTEVGSVLRDINSALGVDGAVALDRLVGNTAPLSDERVPAFSADPKNTGALPPAQEPEKSPFYVDPNSLQSRVLSRQDVPVGTQNEAPLPQRYSSSSLRAMASPFVESREAAPPGGSTAFRSDTLRDGLRQDFQNLGTYGGNANIYGRRNANGVMEFAGTGATVSGETLTNGPGVTQTLRDQGDARRAQSVQGPQIRLPKDRSSDIEENMEKQLRDARSRFTSPQAAGNLQKHEEEIRANAARAIEANQQQINQTRELQLRGVAQAQDAQIRNRAADLQLQGDQAQAAGQQARALALRDKTDFARTQAERQYELEATRLAASEEQRGIDNAIKGSDRLKTAMETLYPDTPENKGIETPFGTTGAVAGQNRAQDRARYTNTYLKNQNLFKGLNDPDMIAAEAKQTTDLIDEMNAMLPDSLKSEELKIDSKSRPFQAQFQDMVRLHQQGAPVSEIFYRAALFPASDTVVQTEGASGQSRATYWATLSPASQEQFRRLLNRAVEQSKDK